MQNFTDNRNDQTIDEIWFLEHYPVFTVGKAGASRHILAPGAIPIIISDRGGQVTYHGPGQLLIYFLIDLARKSLSLKQLINTMLEAVVELLQVKYHLPASYSNNLPGVYINNRKICSIGLKINRSCSYHGLSLNINMDLEPFERINPCGIEGLKMVQLVDFYPNKNQEFLWVVAKQLKAILLSKLNYIELALHDLGS